MFYRYLRFRVATGWLLLGALSGVVPAMAGPEFPALPQELVGMAALPQTVRQPGIPAMSDGTVPRVVRPLQGAMGVAAMPQAAQPTASTSGSGSQSKHRLPTWVWVAIAAGAGVGIGAGVIIGNRQSGHTATVTPGTTITVGGGASAGPPH